MQTKSYIIWIVAVFVSSIIYLLLDKLIIKLFKSSNDSVTYENAKEALSLIANWTTWLTGLQTAAIAAMGFLFDKHPNNQLKTYGFFVLLFFGTSIILTTWLLSSLPSIQQRLIDSKIPDSRNDIYMVRMFSSIPIRLGWFTGLVHTYFLVGIISFALFVFEMFNQ